MVTSPINILLTTFKPGNWHCTIHRVYSGFTVHVLLKPGLENFEHYFTKCVRWVQLCSSLNILWHCLSLGLEWNLIQSCGHCWVFQICWHIECLKLCVSFTASSFRIWNSSPGIPSPPLALFIVMLLSSSEVAQLCLTVPPWTVAYQAPQSMEFSRQEYWSGLPFPSPGDLPNNAS